MLSSRSRGMLLFGVSAIVGASMLLVSPSIIAWSGWTAVSAIATVVAGLGVAGVAYQIILQKKGQSLSEVKFLLGLTDSFLEIDRNYREAFSTLHSYPDPPTRLQGDERARICSALEACYEATLFLYQLSQLLNAEIISGRVLYLLHYNRVVGQSGNKVMFLLRWAGTGIDLEANYNAREIASLIPSVRSLLLEMERQRELHGAERSMYYIEMLEGFEQELANHLSAYEVGGDLGRFITEDKLEPSEVLPPDLVDSARA